MANDYTDILSQKRSQMAHRQEAMALITTSILDSILTAIDEKEYAAAKDLAAVYNSLFTAHRV